jgi:hypothetical protein
MKDINSLYGLKIEFLVLSFVVYLTNVTNRP